MTREEFLLRIGVDNSAVARGLRTIKGQISSFASSIQGQLGSILGGAALYNQFSKVGDLSAQIRNNAAAWAVSNKFVQDIQNVARAAGVSEEKVQSLMDKFVKGLPAGANVQTAFFKMIDGLAAIPDPAERARVAMEAFGKSGMDVIRMAGEGSKAFRELAASYTTLTDAELKAADEAKQRIEDTQQRVTIYTGKLIGVISNAAKAWGTFFGALGSSDKSPWQILGDASNAGKIVEADIEGVNKRRAAARMAADKRYHDYQKSMAEWKKKQTEEQAKLDAKAESDRLKALERRQKAEERVRNAARNASDANTNWSLGRSARSEMTLEEISSLNPNDVHRNAQWKIGAAQRVQWMREQAKLARLSGNEKYAEQLIGRSDQLAQSIGGLTSSDADPEKEMRERSAEAMTELARAAKEEGIKIQATKIQ